MIDFTEDDRRALREVSAFLEEIARLNAHEIEELGSYDWSQRAERAMFFAGRLAGLAGRVEAEQD